MGCPPKDFAEGTLKILACNGQDLKGGSLRTMGKGSKDPVHTE